MKRLEVSCMIVLCFYLTNAQIYKIFQTENVVLNGNITLHIEVPNMERPATWRCGTRKYKCDDTCYGSNDFKVTQSGNSSSLWIRNITKEILSCTCYDNNQNSGKFDLKPNSLAKAEIYEIIQNDNGTLDVNATLQIEIPDMKRPVVWKYDNYKYECDRTCANSLEYRVTHNGNVSTFWIRSVTKERLSWTFEDDNLNYVKFNLKIHSLTRTEFYNITQSGPVALGGNVSLYIDVYDMKRIVVWKNYYGRYECDTACYNYGNYEVTQKDNSSNLLIRNVTKQDFTWRFCDFYLCSENYTLVMKNETELEANGSGNGMAIYAIVILSIAGFVVLLLIVIGVIWKLHKKPETHSDQCMPELMPQEPPVT